MKQLVLMVIVYLGASCSHMIRSGHYIQATSADTWASLAGEFHLSETDLKNANASAHLAAGSWVFVPSTAGLIGATKWSRTPADIDSTQDYLDSGRFLWPVPASTRISSPFGPRWGRHHDGIDIPGRPGMNILAADDGVVVYSGDEMGGYGNIVVLSHDKGFFSVYAHNKKNHVKRGQRVHRGQVIALLGNSGNSTGPHLHFEVRRDSRPLNPKKLVVMR